MGKADGNYTPPICFVLKNPHLIEIMRCLTNDPGCAPQIGLANTQRVPVQLGPDDVFEGWGIPYFVVPSTPCGQFVPAAGGYEPPSKKLLCKN
jgi:hypothetical protein